MSLFAQLSLAQIVACPPEPGIANSPSVHGFRGIEHCVNDCTLGGNVANIAEGQPKWMRYEENARWLDDSGDLGNLGYSQRCQASVVKRALQQTDRLLADWSGRSEQDEIDTLIL